MLHIVFVILKIIGIILAIILGILVLALCVVLFVPLRYCAEAKASGSIDSLNAHLKFSWLLHLISGYIVYENKKAIWQVRVFWKKINQETEVSKTKEDVEVEETMHDTSKKINKVKSKEKKRKKPKFFEKIKYTISNICDKIKMLVQKKEKLEQFLKDEVHHLAWRCLKQELFRLLKILRPKKFEMNLRFGFDDPSVTGKVLAGISMLFPFYPKTIDITPVFTEKVLEGDVFAKGRIRGARLLQVVWNLSFDKNIRKTYKEIQKWKG